MAISILHVDVAAAVAGSEPAREQGELRELRAEQSRLIRQIEARLAALPDDPPPSPEELPDIRDRREKKAVLRKVLGDIERRMNEPGSGKVHLPPGIKFTPEMRVYHGKLLRKIEDCGTGHLPKRDGKTAYGKGFIAIIIDQVGKVLDAEIVESSRDKLVDEHMQRVVRLSSPFGPLPRKLTAESSLSFRSVVILTRFEFGNDDIPIEWLPEKERCKWK